MPVAREAPGRSVKRGQRPGRWLTQTLTQNVTRSYEGLAPFDDVAPCDDVAATSFDDIAAAPFDDIAAEAAALEAAGWQTA